MKKYFIGESCLCWSLGTAAIDPARSIQILTAYQALRRQREQKSLPVLDILPCYNALAVYFDPDTADLNRIEQAVEAEITAATSGTPAPLQGKEITLPVNYNGEDLGRVAGLAHLSTDEVIALHTGARYTVAMIGFLPHFPYLIGLPDKLATPRLDSPRMAVPAGSVVIGGTQTGVYPRESPGGWNIIGTTNPALLESLEPGDTVLFSRT